MKICVVYDSVHGNTEKIAKAIGDALAGEVKVSRVSEVNASEIQAFNLLIAGAPTHGGQASEPMRNWLGAVPKDALQGVNVAAFDTRLKTKWVGIFGYAASKIAAKLLQKGGTLTGSPEGFFVKGSEGPLLEGELERAAGWAKGVESFISE